MYWYNGPGYPMYPGNPGGPYYPAFPGAGWQLDYDSIEGHLWSYYPSLYHEVYPVVERVLNERDDPWRYPVPPRTMVEEMVAEVERRWQWSGEGGGRGGGSGDPAAPPAQGLYLCDFTG